MRRSNTAASAARRLAAGLGAVVALGLAAAPAQAATVPAWDLNVAAAPTHLAPGGTGKLAVRAFDVGSAAPDGSPITLTVRLPAGVTFTGPVAGCSAVDQLVTCTPTVAGGGYGTDVFTNLTLLPVAVDAGMAVGDADVTATVSGGGAVGTETLTQPVRIDPRRRDSASTRSTPRSSTRRARRRRAPASTRGRRSPTSASTRSRTRSTAARRPTTCRTSTSTCRPASPATRR